MRPTKTWAAVSTFIGSYKEDLSSHTNEGKSVWFGPNTLSRKRLPLEPRAHSLFKVSLDEIDKKSIDHLVELTSFNVLCRFSNSANEKLALELTKWTFHQQGVLRVQSVNHNKVGETHARREYTIKDDIEYSIAIEEFASGKWREFDADDLQVELVRIDPFIRKTLKQNGKLIFLNPQP